MRKDVRLGFAVGGVLLAVIIVAILVVHRNRGHEKTVGFDTGGKEAVTPAPDTTTPNTDKTGGDSAPVGVALPTPAAPAREPGDDTPAARATADASDRSDKGNDRWDALFASTAEDPIRAQLTSNAAKVKSHKSAAADADRTIEDAAANSPMDSAPTTPRAVSESATATPVNVDSPRTHRIQSGETFVSISKAVYGDGRYFKAIADANPNVSPEKLRPGMVIQLPPASQVKQSSRPAKSASAEKAPAGPALSADGKTYTVQKNDNLYKIAKQLYGKGEKEGDLYTVNKDVIGPDSTRLKIGMVLRLPEPPTTSR
jgi:nucleoid-associated protein YgaU